MNAPALAESDRCQESFCIAATHPALAGHFPANPVVPGVVLLECVLEFAERRFVLRANTMRMPQVKFLQPLLPGQQAEMLLDASIIDSKSDARIRFRIQRDDNLLASGELVFPATVATATDVTGVDVTGVA